MTLFPAGQDLLGKKASDLVGEDLCVYEDGTVEGTLKAVTYKDRKENEFKEKWSGSRRKRKHDV